MSTKKQNITNNLKLANSRIPICPSHKTYQGGYLDWYAWAENLHRHGIRQKQCPVCTRWLFPEEE